MTFDIKGEESVVGREPGMAVNIALAGVSRRHARIVWDGKSHWIEDLKSTNGTFINGQAVQRERLRHLDVITLGKKVDLVFVVRAEEAHTFKRLGILQAALVPESAEGLPYEIAVGEVTLGRSSTSNVTVDHAAVSKLHARLERRSEQLILQDLGSANGTFLNGTRVTTSVLSDGDVISLAGVESFRVRIELGEVTSSSGARELSEPAPSPTSVEGSRPRFSADWRTKFEWESAEIEALAEFQKMLAAKDAARDAAKAGGRAAAPQRTTTKMAAVRPAAEKTVMRPVEKPSAPAAALVAPPVTSPAAELPLPSRPPAPSPSPASAGNAPAAPSRAQPQSPQAQSPPAPKASPTAPKAAAAIPAPPAPEPPDPATFVSGPTEAAAPRPAYESFVIRLTGEGVDLVVVGPGAHELGRTKGVALRVNHPTVSRRHARILISDDRTIAYVQDLGGANGTRLNGRAVTSVQPLADGDVLTFGQLELKVTVSRS